MAKRGVNASVTGIEDRRQAMESVIPDRVRDALERKIAADDLMCFARYVQPYNVVPSAFHESYYKVLTAFAKGEIRRLIVQSPPQHGKSWGSSRLLPAFLLGRNPNLQVTIGSYSATLANDFNRDIQRIIDTREYERLFPETKLLGMAGTPMHGWLRNTDVFEIVNKRGLLRAVGRGGSLTGKSVDISILDDVYKDYAEAVSPLIRDAAWKWYTSVVRTRLHNKSQELIVFTRWHSDDIIGRLEKSGERIVDIQSINDVKRLGEDDWARINFPAVMNHEPTDIDRRAFGEALWSEKHSLKELNKARDLDPMMFQCLYQGDPSSAEGRLYRAFSVWNDPSDYGELVRTGAYCDPADSGKDYFACVVYEIRRSDGRFYNEKTRKWEHTHYALVRDIIYTKENMDYCMPLVAESVLKHGCGRVWVESNGAGAMFARQLMRKVHCSVVPFHQRLNKEARILGAATYVNGGIVFPYGWEKRFAEAFMHVNEYLSDFRANAHDDIEDALTGVWEKELANGGSGLSDRRGFGIRRRN